MGEREDFVKKAAKKFSKGTYTASQTGAKQYAKQRNEAAQLNETLKSAGSMEDFEKNINGGGASRPRPARSKRY